MSFWQVELQETLSSTQDYVRSQAFSGAGEGLVVRAISQTGGRGRHGRSWAGGKGNLCFSFLLRPDCAPRDIGTLSLVIGISLHQTLSAYINHDQLLLKWPNDVLIAGKKCAGVLLETEINPNDDLNFVVVGIGLNLSSEPIEGSACLNDYTDHSPKPDDILSVLLNTIEKNYKKWSTDGFGVFQDEWKPRSHKAGDAITVKLADKIYEGTYIGVDQNGNLEMNAAGRAIKLSSGDLFLPFETQSFLIKE